ncbi:ComEA family DNA-binding protein [Maioricimonas rarisocia]|nr:helix-hairpin-helix domain-containing protein [Maioricimonas rarisocia]
MSAGDRVFTLTCVVLGCLLLLVHWARQEGAGLEPVEIERLDPAAYNYRVDANSATWVELMLLEGIGEQLARRIVADREQSGPFASVDDLERVRGIGPKTLARIRPGLQCLPPESFEPEETP